MINGQEPVQLYPSARNHPSAPEVRMNQCSTLFDNLAIVLLADLTAVLPSHPDRVAAFLGKARIVDDPGLDRILTLDQRQDFAAYPGQQSLVRPLALGHEVMHRLMGGLDTRWRDPGRHRLDALASTRQEESKRSVTAALCG